jgi:hypothetical protein
MPRRWDGAVLAFLRIPVIQMRRYAIEDPRSPRPTMQARFCHSLRRKGSPS